MRACFAFLALLGVVSCQTSIYFTLQKFDLENLVKENYGSVSGWVVSNGTNGKSPVISMDLISNVTITNLHLRLTVSLSSKMCELCHKAVDQEVDFCKLVKRRRNPGYVRTAFRYLKKFGNLPSSCPVLPGNYTLRDVVVERGILPSYLPEGLVRLDVQANATVGSEVLPVANIAFVGTITREGFGF